MTKWSVWGCVAFGCLIVWLCMEGSPKRESAEKLSRELLGDVPSRTTFIAVERIEQAQEGALQTWPSESDSGAASNSMQNDLAPPPVAGDGALKPGPEDVLAPPGFPFREGERLGAPQVPYPIVGATGCVDALRMCLAVNPMQLVMTEEDLAFLQEYTAVDVERCRAAHKAYQDLKDRWMQEISKGIAAGEYELFTKKGAAHERLRELCGNPEGQGYTRIASVIEIYKKNGVVHYYAAVAPPGQFSAAYWALREWQTIGTGLEARLREGIALRGAARSNSAGR